MFEHTHIFHFTVKIEVEFDTVLPWQGGIRQPFSSKDGSCFYIYRPEELARPVWKPGKYFFMNNFDLGGLNTPQAKWNHVDIHSSRVYGNNKTIHNIYAEGTGKQYETIAFAWLYNTGVSDLHLVSGQIIGDRYSDGSFFGGQNICIGQPNIAAECVISNCTNGANISIGNAAGIVYFSEGYCLPESSSMISQKNVMSCINFGDMRTDRGGNGITGSVFGRGIGSSINCGNISGTKSSGINGKFSDYYPGEEGYVYIDDVFSIGRIFSNKATSAKIVQDLMPYEHDVKPWRISHAFADEQMCPNIPMFGDTTRKSANSVMDSNAALTTRQLIDADFMRQRIKDTNSFIFENGFYPRLKNIDERPGRLAASPLILDERDDVSHVTHKFYVDTNYGVSWNSTNNSVVKIEGDSGYILSDFPLDTTIKIEARKDVFTKRVYLTIAGYIHLKTTDTTLCPGDSVLFGGKYCQLEGFYQDTVYRSATDTIDTIFSLNLHLAHIYNEHQKDSTYRDLLPYHYNEHEITNFGTYTFLYSSVYGCDSLIQFTLDSLLPEHRVSISSNSGGAVFPLGDTLVKRGDSVQISIDPEYCTLIDSILLNELPQTIDSIFVLKDIRENYNIRVVVKYVGCKIDTLFFRTVSNICEGDSVFFGDKYERKQGVYSDTIYHILPATTDSIFVLDLSVYSTFEQHENLQCKRSQLPFSYGGKTYTDFGCDTLYYQTLHGCDSNIFFCLQEIKATYTLYTEAGQGGSVFPNGDTILQDGDNFRVSWTARPCYLVDSLFIDGHYRAKYSASSYTFKNIQSEHHLRVTFVSDSISLYQITSPDSCCGQEFLHFEFSVEKGKPTHYSLDFNTEALEQGFIGERDILQGRKQKVEFAIPTKPHVDIYYAYLQANNEKGCTSPIYTIPVEILYPAQDMVRQKWNTVLAVRSREFNGGYDFTAFQWMQDNKILPKDTTFRLFQRQGLRAKSVYRVLLTRADGTTISSCPIIPSKNPQKQKVFPNPIKEGGAISIIIEDCQEINCGDLYICNINGQEQGHYLLNSGVNSLSLHLSQGVYLFKIHAPDGSTEIFKIIVIP